MTSVCALIPHYRCEAWLAGAIESLLAQTRPLDAIVVIDDCSPEPPERVVDNYPRVSLFSARHPENVGPYRLIQQVIDSTGFDAYLFQDADDWSAPDRLELLVATADETGAELVGSHEVRVLVDEAEAQPYRYALDVNAALRERPSSFPLLHPTSLVRRDLVQRIGGFSTGLRFSGDAEFLRRAAHAARVVNVDRYLYFRRKRSHSLTTAPETGLQSPARLQLRAQLAARAEENAARVQRGEHPDLAPLTVAGPVPLEHVCGPTLADLNSAPVPHLGTIGAEKSALSSGGPVFVIGGPRSGMGLLTWALGQHRNLSAIPDGRWLAQLAALLVHSRSKLHAPPEQLSAGLLSLPTGRRAVAAHPELATAASALVDLFPDARFVHLVRAVDDVVDSYRRAPTDDDLFLTADLAAEYWRRTGQAALDVERAFGAASVLRVRYDDLLKRPEQTLARCLAFLGESFDPACLRPLIGVEPPHAASLQPVPDAVRGLNAELLDESGGPGAPDPDARLRLFRSAGAPLVRRSMAHHLRGLVDACVPPVATVLVASKGDPTLVDLDGRHGWHFPQDERGSYAGYHPADSDDAVMQLERLVVRGAEYFALPASAFWWLDHYVGLAAWLSERCRLVAYQEDAGAVWRLGSRPSWCLSRVPTVPVMAEAVSR